MVADALAMLGEVWTVRRGRTTRTDGEVGTCPDRVPRGGQRRRPTAWAGDHPGRRAARPPGQLTTAMTKASRGAKRPAALILVTVALT